MLNDSLTKSLYMPCYEDSGNAYSSALQASCEGLTT